ncbi:agmatine deiminase family protein [Streptomyces apocyni]|uniref:agmatine deiminase family protein n=1 Tax=Streptomyces apocyni TaxID=2654677 RepID=UPI0012EAFAC6|nr:agmatine deiminase family protein [Streptomyces apocyni]
MEPSGFGCGSGQQPDRSDRASWERIPVKYKITIAAAVARCRRELSISSRLRSSELGRRGEDFLGSYANYYLANDAVLVPRFGDRKADQRAAAVIGDLYPGREVVELEIHTVAEGGGGIHCATQQQPKA